MSTQLFRPEVIEAGRERLTGTVVAAVPPRARLYSLLLFAVAAIMVAILLFGRYASGARVRGVVAYDSGIARVYPTAQGEVRAIHVREGQLVEAETPLVTVALARGSNGLAGQLAQLAVQDAELARQQDLAAQLGSSEEQSLGRQTAGIAAAVASLERQRSIASGQIGLAEAASRRAAALAREGAGTQRQVEDSRARLLERRAEVEAINERLIAQRDALRTLEARRTQRAIETSQTQSVTAAQRAALSEQREALLRAQRLVLTAPIAGEVGDIAVEVGQRARPDASLVTIVPSGSSLEVWLYAPSRAVGFVRPGQEVRLLFDAYPYQKYGAGRGVVTEVSRVHIEPTAIEADLGLQEPVFRIRVRIEGLPPRELRGDQPLRAGMTLSATLVLERRRLWEVLFNPVLGAVRQ